MIADLPVSLPLVRDGKLKAFGVTSRERARAAPDIPTIAEAGVPGYAANGWFAVVVRAGTPQPIVEQLNRVLMSYLTRDEVREQLRARGIEPLTSTPDELRQFIASEISKWAQVVKDAGIVPQ